MGKSAAETVREIEDTRDRLESEIRAKLPHVEVLTHLEPLEDPKSYEK